MASASDELRRAYDDAIEHAAAVEMVAARGLTPREQRDKLAHSRAEWGGDVQRLCLLLERCLYAERETPAEVDEALALCTRLRSSLPPRPPRIANLDLDESDDSRGVELRRWSAALPYLGVIVLVLVVLWGASRVTLTGWSWPSFGSSQTNFASRVSDTGSGQLEQTLVPASPLADPSWKSSPANGTWTAMGTTDTLSAEANDASLNRPFDYDTGSDGYFPGAVDPFRPPLSWTHRRIVYNAMTPDLRPARRAGAMRTAEGEAPPDAVRYRAEVKVILQPGVPTLIPSSAPDAVVTGYSSVPRADVRFRKDEADALYAVTLKGGFFTLRYDLACGRGYRQGALPDMPFTPTSMSLPASLHEPATNVINAIGEVPRPTYAETVGRLHAYFSSFVVATLEPDEIRGTSYETVALARKGVCRHRARTFFLTANALGIETRLVENRTHSFCEVRLPDDTWRRLEFRLEGLEGPAGPTEPPPGATSDRTASGAQGIADSLSIDAAALMLLPLLLIVMTALLWRGRREDISGHRLALAPMPSRFNRRRWRDVNQDVTRDKAQDLLGLVMTRLSDSPLAPTSPVPVAPGISGAVPAHLLERARKLEGLAQHPDTLDASDARDMQRFYWDCYYVLDGLQRRERP